MRQAWRITVFSFFLFDVLYGAIIYPQVAVGGGYRSILIISNKSGEDWHGKLKAYRGNAEPWNVDWQVDDAFSESQPLLTVALPANETRKIEIQGEDDITAGYLILESDPGYSEESIAFSFFYNLLGSADTLQDSTGIPPGEKGTAFVVAVERSETVNTGIAWAPAASVTPFNVRARLVGVDGQTIQEKELLFEGHKARFFSEMFDSVPENFLGKLTLEAAQSFSLTALRLEIGEGIQLTSTPPQRVSTVAESPLVLKQGTFWFRKHDYVPDAWILSGTIKNRSSEDAAFPQLAFAAYAANGELLGGDYSFVQGQARNVAPPASVITSSCILAGQEGYFSMRLSAVDAPETFEFVIFAGGFRETVAPLGNVVASEYEIKEVDGKLRLEAELKNTGTKPVALDWITAFLFDDQDRILTMVLGKADKEQLAPGETASFAEDTLVRTTPVAKVFFSPSWEDVDGQATSLSAGPKPSATLEEAFIRLRRRYHQLSGQIPARVVGKTTVRVPE